MKTLQRVRPEKVRIDYDRCVGCGLCADDCSRRCLRMAAGGSDSRDAPRRETGHGAPNPANTAACSDQTADPGRYPVCEQELCNECGHCFAVCPQGAVSLTAFDKKNVLPVEKEKLGFDADRFIYFQKCRRSIRRFKDRPVEDDVLAKLFEAARFSPTGGNLQNNRYIVLRAELPAVREAAIKALYRAARAAEARAAGGADVPAVPHGGGADASAAPEIPLPYVSTWQNMYEEYASDGTDRLFYGAPCVIAMTGDPASVGSVVDAGIAASRIELTADFMGLGVCYLGFLRRAAGFDPQVGRLLGLEDKEEVLLAFALGYPDAEYLRTVDRRQPQVSYR